MRVAAAFLLSTSLWAQAAFQNLAPNSDGSRVYFSSPLRLKGTDEYPNQPKIFSWDQKGAVHLYEQKPPSILNFVPGLGWDSTTAYNLIAPSTSSDARTIAITGLSDCNDGEDCAYSVNRYQAEIRVAGGAPIVMNGVPSVSPNGHYVALGPSVQHSFATPLTILQLATGNQAHIVNILGFARRHGIANDGTTFVNDTSLPNPVQIRRWWGAMEPLNANPYTPAQIDGAATHVFYTSFDHPSTETPLDLIALDIATNVSTILSSVDLQSASSFDISDDGSLVGFVRLGSAWLVHSDGSGLLQIPKLNDNVVEVAVSGDGNHLFVITASSQIVRIDLATMSVAEIIPATPAPSGLNLEIAGQTLQTVSLGSLCEASASKQQIPDVASVSIFGRDFAILSATPSTLQLQVPFDVPAGVGWPYAVLKQQPAGPFESAMLWVSPVQISAYNPAWHFMDDHVAALHQDFSGPVTDANPAHAGEIIHAYGNGFGPVAPQPPLGEPALANPLSRTTITFVCGLLGDNMQAVRGDLLFSGLAPGWMGLYQFDIRLPMRPGAENPYLICGKPQDFGPNSNNLATGSLPMSAN